MRCDEVMKSNPECLGRGQTVQQAARRMRDLNIGFLPICDAGKVVGVITDRDIAIRVAADGKPFDLPCDQVMTTQVVACRPEDDIHKAEQLMGQARKSRILVTEANGKLVGVISLSDIAQQVDDPDDVARTMREVTDREARSK
ncbi:MAG: CBS domain-containing protein [Pseudomonadota bacterium]|nr:CBS domain-containing protein [Pseudomonadota bacterium]